MLATLLSWIYISFITYTLGKAVFEFWLSRHTDSEYRPPFYLLCLCGFCTLLAGLGIYALFLPVNYKVSLATFTGCLLYTLFSYRKSKLLIPFSIPPLKENPDAYTGLLILILFAADLLWFSAQRSSNYDTRFYYLQTIQWLENYAAVPGLGNLHGRLAFNSSLFQAGAFFGFSSFFGQPVLALTGWLYLHTAIAVIQQISRKNRYSLLAAGLLFLAFIHFRSWVSSCTPDIASLLLLILMLMIVLEIVNEKPGNAPDFRIVVLVLLICASLTIKLSTLPIAALPLFLIYTGHLRLSKSNLMILGGIVLVSMLPWFARNVIQTGYLIYPFPSIDLFDTDWKMPLADVVVEKEFIRYFAVNRDPDWQKVATYPFSKWVQLWLSGIPLFWKVLLAGAAASPVFCAFLLLRDKHLKSTSGRAATIIPLWLVFYAGAIFWFLSAPDTRFGAAFIYISFLLPAYSLLLPFIEPYFKTFTRAFLLLILILCLYAVTTDLRDIVYLARHQSEVLKKKALIPEAVAEIPVNTIMLDGIRIAIPKSGVFCNDTPIPCTFELRKNLELRGKTLAEGFRIGKGK